MTLVLKGKDGGLVVRMTGDADAKQVKNVLRLQGAHPVQRQDRIFCQVADPVKVSRLLQNLFE